MAVHLGRTYSRTISPPHLTELQRSRLLTRKQQEVVMISAWTIFTLGFVRMHQVCLIGRRFLPQTQQLPALPTLPHKAEPYHQAAALQRQLAPRAYPPIAAPLPRPPALLCHLAGGHLQRRAPVAPRRRCPQAHPAPLVRHAAAPWAPATRAFAATPLRRRWVASRARPAQARAPFFRRARLAPPPQTVAPICARRAAAARRPSFPAALRASAGPTRPLRPPPRARASSSRSSRSPKRRLRPAPAQRARWRVCCPRQRRARARRCALAARCCWRCVGGGAPQRWAPRSSALAAARRRPALPQRRCLRPCPCSQRRLLRRCPPPRPGVGARRLWGS
jgi:hypothetical protein